MHIIKKISAGTMLNKKLNLPSRQRGTIPTGKIQIGKT
jgi:hypothetical protein